MKGSFPGKFCRVRTIIHTATRAVSQEDKAGSIAWHCPALSLGTWTLNPDGKRSNVLPNFVNAITLKFLSFERQSAQSRERSSKSQGRRHSSYNAKNRPDIYMTFWWVCPFDVITLSIIHGTKKRVFWLMFSQIRVKLRVCTHWLNDWSRGHAAASNQCTPPRRPSAVSEKWQKQRENLSDRQTHTQTQRKNNRLYGWTPCRQEVDTMQWSGVFTPSSTSHLGADEEFGWNISKRLSLLVALVVCRRHITLHVLLSTCSPQEQNTSNQNKLECSSIATWTTSEKGGKKDWFKAL